MSLFVLLFAAGVLTPGCTYELHMDHSTEAGTDTAASTDATAGSDSTTPGTGDGTDSDGDPSSDADTDTGGTMASFDVRESVEQLHVTHATPGIELEVRDGAGAKVASGVTDDLGSLVFRELAPGDDYAVQTVDGSDRAYPLTVMSVAGSLPDPSFYEGQPLVPGYQYIETRDGTKLSVYITMPGPPEDGPYPTVINYSGYEPSKPGAPLNASDLEGTGLKLEDLCADLPILCDVPNHPSGIIAGIMGFATVGVNMRGTGCSGGAYDFFETMQTLDGYDIIETVASQEWVQDNRVALVGLSYPGLSQMWVAQTNPPSLAAITPLSVFANAATSVLAPGGLFNDGFALNWADNVLDGADPYGQGWEQGLIDAGDTICEENQLLHGQKVDTVQKALMHPFYDAAIGDPLAPEKFVHKIDVPVFMAGAWQDEQTGGHFPELFKAFSGAPIVRLTGYNGVHADGYAPQDLVEWHNFLNFYLARRIPEVPPLVRTLSPLLFEQFFGAKIAIPEDRFLMAPSYDAALAMYEAEDPIRIIFESGAKPGGTEGAPEGAYELTLTEWPSDDLAPQRWYMHPGGFLGTFEPPADGGASKFMHNPDAGDDSTLPSGDINGTSPPWNWQPEVAGETVAFISEPLADDVVMIGPASVDLWIRSNADEADLEVTISEVRPDNQEMLVQSGWLRASHRFLSSESTPLRPIQTHLATDAEPLTPGAWTEARVEMLPFAHAFRAGSRLRITIDTPGGERAEWGFILHDFGDPAEHSVGHDAAHPSSVLLPVMPGVDVPTKLPPCPSLRGQPCRAYESFTNTPAE